MRIIVAGAGAGKTTSMAGKVISRYKELLKSGSKMIFVVCYTNSAKNNIKKEIININGSLPKEINVSTIHSFLLHQVIYPFHHLIYDKPYVRSTQANLPSDRVYKARRKKELGDMKIIHVEDVTRVAKNIIFGKSDDRKINRLRRTVVLQFLTKYIDSIFVDEAQDMDNHFSLFLKKMNKKKVNIKLIGDPKQDLRGGPFPQLIKENDKVVYKTHTHRCPIKHIDLSNQYVNQEEKQNSNKENGILNYMLETDINVKKEVNIDNYDLIYIYQKSGQFITNKKQKIFEHYTLFTELKTIIKKQNIIEEKYISPYVYVYMKRILQARRNKHSPKQITNKLFNNFLDYSCEHYARLIQAIKEIEVNSKENEKILVDSIDNIKGLEGERCLFIITTAIARYLFKEKKDKNKMMNYLYVGLTRSKKELTFLVASDVEKNYGREYIQRKFYELDVCKKDLNKS